MKKRITMLMCAVVLSMTACGSQEPNVAASNEVAESTENVVAENEEASVESSEAEETAESAANSENAEVVADGAAGESVEAAADTTAGESAELVSETEEVEEIEYEFGTFTETGYDAEWFGYRFTTPEGCVLATREELISMLGLTMDVLSEDFNETIMEYLEQTAVCDLYAMYETSSTNVNVCIQKVPTSFFTLEDLVDQSAKQMESLDVMNATVHEGREKVEIAGHEYIKLDIDTEMEGIALKQQIYTTMVPDYVITVNVTWQEGNEAEAEALLAAFTEL